MPNQKQLKTLQRDVLVWNRWREKHPDENIDLRGADLKGANLKGADFIEADLSGAHFNEADLSRACFSRADLSEATLIRSDLGGAYFNGANLGGANLNGACLRKANLNGADLSRANLSRADLSLANLSRAHLSQTDLSGTDLKGADLRRAHLSEAHFDGANLNKSIIGLTIFERLDLRMVKGLETIQHQGPSEISTSTLEKSNGEIPDIFLKGVGVSDTLIAYTRSLFCQPIEYYTCFISYSSKDQLFAQRLHNDLQQEGIRCWFAPEDMDIGDEIKDRIDASIHLYDKLLLILSEHSIKSSWVAYEVKRALSKEPLGIPNVLYPVCVDQTILTCAESWAREIKETRHIGNFQHWTDPEQYQYNFKRLLRALNVRKEQRKS